MKHPGLKFRRSLGSVYPDRLLHPSERNMYIYIYIYVIYIYYGERKREKGKEKEGDRDKEL